MDADMMVVKLKMPFTSSEVQAAVEKHAGQRLARDLRETLEDDIREQLKQKIDSQLSKTIKQVLETPHIPVNRFGEPKGDPETLREFIAEKGEEYLCEKVDKKGRKTHSPGDELHTRMEWAVMRMSQKVFKEQLENRIDEAVEEIRDQLTHKTRKKLAEAINDSLGANVLSEKDK